MSEQSAGPEQPAVPASPAAGEPILQIRDLHAHYGAAHILQGVTLDVHDRPVAVVGRNGMGKTTLCKTIMGLTPRTSGTVTFRGQDLPAESTPRDVARRGIGYVPQGRRIFPTVTVDEHLRMIRIKPDAVWTPSTVYELYPRLTERRNVRAGSLSGGEQQMLAIARALLVNGTLLILDEPSEGLAPIIVDQLTETLRHIATTGVGVLLIEQQLQVAIAVADDVVVMVNGRSDSTMRSTEVGTNTDLRQRLLGVS
jgi:branched-chain amino acid transport system ATP-binding protein